MTNPGKRRRKRKQRRKQERVKRAAVGHLTSDAHASPVARHIEEVVGTTKLLSPPASRSVFDKLASLNFARRDDRKSSSKKSERRTKRPESLKKVKPSRKSVAARRRRLPNPRSGPIHGLRNFIWKTFAAVAVIFLLYAYAARFDLSHWAPGLEQLAENHLNLNLDIGGKIGLVMPVIRPGIYIEDITVRGSGQDAADAMEFDRVEVRFAFSSLFDGGDVLQLLSLTIFGAEVDVVPHTRGKSSLQQMTDVARQFENATGRYWGAMSIGELTLRESNLVWRGNDGEAQFEMPLEKMDFWAEDDLVQLNLTGHAGEELFSLGGTLKGIDSFQNGGFVSVDMTGALGSTFVILSGEVSGRRDGNSELLLQALGPNISGLAGIIGYGERVVPAPFELSLFIGGNLTGRMAGELDGKFNSSVFTGQLQFNATEGPALNLDIENEMIDLQILKPFLSLPLSGLNVTEEVGFIGDINMSFDAVTAGRVDLGPGRLTFSSGADSIDWRIEQGDENVGELKLRLQGGRGQEGVLSLSAAADAFDFGTVLSVLNRDFDAVGIASLRTDLTAGRVENGTFAGLTGKIEMIGAAERFIVVRSGLIPRDLEVVLGEDLLAGSVIRDACLVTEARMRNGRLTAKSLAFETENVITTGGGYIDFDGDNVKMLLRARPKDPRRMNSAVDIEIAGRLSAPIIRPEDRSLSRGLSGSLSPNGLQSEDGSLIKSVMERPGGAPCVESLLGY